MEHAADHDLTPSQDNFLVYRQCLVGNCAPYQYSVSGDTLMRSRLHVGVAALATLGLAACVSPDVVLTNSVSDESLTCAQIEVQLKQLEEIRKEASKGQTASGANVAAAILFWPAIIGNYQNAKQALEAADKRNEVLVALAKKKRCRF